MSYKGMEFKKFNLVSSRLRKAFVKKGSINNMLMNQMSLDAVDFCIQETKRGGYDNLSEYFADQIIEIYFKELSK